MAGARRVASRAAAWAAQAWHGRRPACPATELPTPPIPVESALSQSHRQLLMAEQIAGVGYWRLSVPDHVIQWSAEVYRIYGIDPAAGLPTLDAAIAAYHPEDRAAVSNAVETAIRDAAGYATQWRLLRPDGDMRHVLSRGMTELGADGRVVALFGVFLDITVEHRAAAAAEAAQAELQAVSERARQAAEASNESLHRLARHLERALGRAEQGSQAKSRFLAGMSHELRTPLNGILGYAQLLRMEGGLNATQLGRVGSMLEAGSHLLDMINRVLDLSEVEAGRMELQRSIIDLQATASLCLDFVRPAAAAKALGLELELAQGLPKTMVGDPTRLRQVLLNLLGNAVKFTPSGAVRMHLAPASGGSRLRVEVADTGPGIPPHHSHLLFRDFERLEGSSASTEGAGLGLAISAQIAAAMGGAVGHQDNPGGGSIFWLDVPLGDPAPLPLHLPAPAPGQDAMRVLVVDDVEMNRTIAAGFLAAAGHTVTCVDGGTAAITAIGVAPFDLVFMDVRMPGMDGLEATRRIRLLPAGRDVPIVALTAQAFAEQIEACRQAGMDGHLSKPFTPQTMQAAIGEGIAAARRRTQPAAAMPAAPEDADTPVFDQAALDRIAAFMPRAAIAQHLTTLADKCAALLRALGRLAPGRESLADEAHALAGSAGLFGFLRLAEAARRLERAARDSQSDLPAAAADLAEQIETVILTISVILPEAVAA